MYFYGTVADDAPQHTPKDTLYAWAYEEDIFIPLKIDGYLINKHSSEPGCYFVLEDETVEGQISLAYCLGGKIERIDDIPCTDNVIRVYGFDGEWLYYSYSDAEENLAVCRRHKSGVVEHYEMEGFIDNITEMENLVFSISDAGALAFLADLSDFFSTSKLCLALPNGETTVLFDDVSSLVWLNSEELIFQYRPDDQFQVYHMTTGKTEYLTMQNGEPLLSSSIYSNVCISPDRGHMAYIRYENHSLGGKNYLDSIWNPLEVLSLRDGNRISSRDVCIGSDMYSPYMCLQLGE